MTKAAHQHRPHRRSCCIRKRERDPSRVLKGVSCSWKCGLSQSVELSRHWSPFPLGCCGFFSRCALLWPRLLRLLLPACAARAAQYPGECFRALLLHRGLQLALHRLSSHGLRVNDGDGSSGNGGNSSGSSTSSCHQFLIRLAFLWWPWPSTGMQKTVQTNATMRADRLLHFASGPFLSFDTLFENLAIAFGSQRSLDVSWPPRCLLHCCC